MTQVNRRPKQREGSRNALMQIRGVLYDTGRHLGFNWRPHFDRAETRQDLITIRDDLHANTVKLCGRDLDRLTMAAEDALDLGLDVWLSPELWNHTPQRTLAYLAEAARRAEAIRTAAAATRTSAATRTEPATRTDPATRDADTLRTAAARDAQATPTAATRDADTARTTANRDADTLRTATTRDAETTPTAATRDADTLRTATTRDAETARTAANRDADTARTAATRDTDTIRAAAGGRERVVLSVATEASFFLRGILPGRTFAARTKNPAAAIRAGRHAEPLAAFLAAAAATARREFQGPISYASLPFERVDWGMFDFVGVDHYRYVTSEPHYERILERCLRHGKPLVITEFGMRAYRGAELDPDLLTTGLISWPTVALRRVPFVRPRLQRGKLARLQTGNAARLQSDEAARPQSGMADRPQSGMADRPQSGNADRPQTGEADRPQRGKAARPQAGEAALRDEALQARRIAEDLAIFERMGVAGAMVTQFDEPLFTHDADPRFDLDMSGFSLVTTPQRKKKEAFHAVAHHYAGGPGRLGVPFSQP
ncbi:hypothetical protein [Dactylosporangium sp. CS-033363]|uniref:hypothetical protein n=1 Tax=Dactylosporangium sp. CS-033363 TaxID=3239935 RepID=UPI003D8D5DA5